jgi:3-hydroxybutyryl-CoA dehydrogenase
MKRIAVIGAGTMGHGIAQVASVAGYQTVLHDASADALASAIPRIRDNLVGGVARGKLSQDAADAALDRLTTETDLAQAVGNADLVVEAIVEDQKIKRALFKKLDQLTPAEAILVSNTSSLSISRMAAATGRASRVMGMHFFNPVHIMKLVELVRHAGVDDGTVERVREVAVRMGKEPILVSDAPGFASSRLGVVLGLEAMRMVEQGVATPADIDKALELGYGHPMGPLRVTDMVGLDVRLAIAEYLHRELKDDQYEPPQILRDKVANGELGKKTGKGFYAWDRKTPS